MNQDQIKERLLRLRRPATDFSVILSGKKSRKVNGLYKPETREIVLHNRNFEGDNELMYTAIHEFAHHLHFSSAPVPVSVRAHTNEYWSLFHSLLFEAEELGLYVNPFEELPEFVELTRRIKEQFLTAGGELVKELGALLVRAQELCEKHHTSFSDYLDRVLGLPRASAATMMKAHSLDVNPRVGFENMRTLVRVKDADERREAEEALLQGKSPDMVKREFLPPSSREEADPLRQLVREKERLERQIGRLRRRLEEISGRLAALEEEQRSAGGRERHRAAAGLGEQEGLPPRVGREV